MRHGDAWGGFNQAEEAQQALDAGIDPREAWDRFGWSDNAYGQPIPLYTAISDEPMVMNIEEGTTRAPFERVIDHPELFTAIPQLKSFPTEVTLDPSTTNVSGGITFAPGRDLGITVHGPVNRRQIGSALIHEGMHGAVNFARFPKGAALPGIDPHLYRWDTLEAQNALREFEMLAGEHGFDPRDRSFPALAERSAKRLVERKRAGRLGTLSQ